MERVEGREGGGKIGGGQKIYIITITKKVTLKNWREDGLIN